jgi:hypothetical protein
MGKCYYLCVRRVVREGKRGVARSEGLTIGLGGFDGWGLGPVNGPDRQQTEQIDRQGSALGAKHCSSPATRPWRVPVLSPVYEGD